MTGRAKDIEGFDKDAIIGDLKKENRNDVRIFFILMDILFTPCVMDIVKNLESDFKDQGNRHYPRLLLLGIIMFCFARKINKYDEIVKQCKENRFLRIYTRGAEPCESTFRNFLNTNKSEEFRKIFLYTLLRFNEYDLLKFLHMFIDSTDAIVRGSKYFKIYAIEIDAMKFMIENRLIHNGKPKQMKRSIRLLFKMKEQNPEDEELNKIIDLIIPRIQIYNRKMYKKLDIFQEALDKSNKDFVCITYPNAPLIKTKKGKWDFAKNLQMAVSDNNIIIGSIFINDPDDSHTLEKLMPELHRNFELLAELVGKYGTRNNTSTIKNLIQQAMIICDSGYDSEDNIIYIHENEIRSLIMPKITSRFINRQIRKAEEELEILSGPIEICDEEEFEKRDMRRIWNGYKCQFNRTIICYENTPIKSEVAKGLPDIATKRTYKYKSLDCSGCPYQETCKYKSFTEKIKPYSYDSMNKLTQKFYQDLYMERFQTSESVFGYFKGIDGILHLMGNNDIAISNEMDIRSAVYNTIHLVEMKGTFC